MKLLRPSLLFTAALVLMTACKKDKEEVAPTVPNELDGLHLVTTLTGSGHSVDLFNPTGTLRVGYNKLFMRVKDGAGQSVLPTTVDWVPMMTMDMGGMPFQHSCPHSGITRASGKETLYEGYIVFSMASNGASDSWALTLTASLNGQSLVLTGPVAVTDTETPYSKVFASAMGTDGAMYLLAMVEPTSPQSGVNDIIATLHRKDASGDYPVVDGFVVKVDPRMPGMGNHTAPGSVDMTQGADGLYHGKVGFSMSGYWKINLVVVNTADEGVAGQKVTADNLESTLHFKVQY